MGLPPRVTLSIMGIVAILLVIASILVLQARPDPVQITINPPVPTATALPTATPEPVTVYVTGAVGEPQTTITLPFGSRVSDALDAAGGTSDDADLNLVNLAAILRDGDQVHVPSLPEIINDAADSDTAADAPEPIALPTRSGGELVAINSATLEELTTLPGIGEVTAQRILDYRDENGPFASLEDLDNVSGIGAATLENLEPLLIFD